MARSLFTLAALASATAPGVQFVGVRPSAGAPGSGDSRDFDTAVLTTNEGAEYLLRVPLGPAAEHEQGAELVALAAFTPGVRSRLPFDLPTVVGHAWRESVPIVLFELSPGTTLSEDFLPAAAARATARAIAAIHDMPTAFVSDAGLPCLDADGVRAEVTSVIDRAKATGQLPVALHQRWCAARDDEELWRLRPTVVNGQLDASSFAERHESIVAVSGWSGLSVGDPARDLAWLVGSHQDVAGTALEAYNEARGVATDPLLEKRALLHAELELARWLIHGHELHDEATVADAVALLDGLVENVHHDHSQPLTVPPAQVLGVTEVQHLLLATHSAASTHTDAGHPGAGLTPIVEDPESWQEDTRAARIDHEPRPELLDSVSLGTAGLGVDPRGGSLGNDSPDDGSQNDSSVVASLPSRGRDSSGGGSPIGVAPRDPRVTADLNRLAALAGSIGSEGSVASIHPVTPAVPSEVVPPDDPVVPAASTEVNQSRTSSSSE